MVWGCSSGGVFPHRFRWRRVLRADAGAVWPDPGCLISTIVGYHPAAELTAGLGPERPPPAAAPRVSSPTDQFPIRFSMSCRRPLTRHPCVAECRPRRSAGALGSVTRGRRSPDGRTASRTRERYSFERPWRPPHSVHREFAQRRNQMQGTTSMTERPIRRPTQRAVSDYSQLLLSVQARGLFRRRYAYYTIKIAALLASLTGVVVAFAVLGDSWAQIGGGSRVGRRAHPDRVPQP